MSLVRGKMFVFKDKQQNHPAAQLKNDTNALGLPPLVGNVLTDSKCYINNLFADTWKTLKMNSLIKNAGFTKRSGIQISETVFLLLLWTWLNMSSIAMFSRKALGSFSMAKNDVMYDLLNREQINWREFNYQTAKAVYQLNKLAGIRVKAFVLDDSIKRRCGKKWKRSPITLITSQGGTSWDSRSLLWVWRQKKPSCHWTRRFTSARCEV